MSKRWYRSLRTTAERRANSNPEVKDFVRAKRRGKNLPNSWDDYRVCVQKTWKERHKTRYRVGKRGQRHEYFLSGTWSRKYEWDFIEYCEAHNIPHTVEPVHKSYTYYRKEQVFIPTLDVFGKPVLHPIYGCRTGEWVFTGKYTEHRGTQTIGTKLIWWSDKDIGIEYII